MLNLTSLPSLKMVSSETLGDSRVHIQCDLGELFVADIPALISSALSFTNSFATDSSVIPSLIVTGADKLQAAPEFNPATLSKLLTTECSFTACEHPSPRVVRTAMQVIRNFIYVKWGNGNVHRAAANIIVFKSRAARGSVCNVLLFRVCLPLNRVLE